MSAHYTLQLPCSDLWISLSFRQEFGTKVYTEEWQFVPQMVIDPRQKVSDHYADQTMLFQDLAFPTEKIQVLCGFCFENNRAALAYTLKGCTDQRNHLQLRFKEAILRLAVVLIHQRFGTANLIFWAAKSLTFSQKPVNIEMFI